MTEAYIGLGGNIGDALASIRKAFELLASLDGVKSAQLSPIYRSAPVGYVDQDWFFNAVAKVEVTLGCDALLEHCLAIELQLKRVREERWGPRIIDLDIILFGNLELELESLNVPHPRAHERAFVLRPLIDLNSQLIIKGRSVLEWLKDVEDQKIERVE